jgi:DNA-binding transcriptional regulator YdaS (Cro superfamily)
MTGRPYTRAQYLSIKFAFRRACEDIGSLQVIAEHTRVDPSRLSQYCNAERPEFPPTDVMMDVDALSGGQRCLRALAEINGFALVRDEKGIAVEDMARHVGSVGKESGELISEMCTAIADGKVTPNEASRIETAAEDVKDNIVRLQDDCRRIRAGER